MIKNDILLIIGNGFDLQCGLKSSYADFFDWLRKDDTRSNANLWAVHFLSSPPTGQRWADVENKLQKLLSETNDIRFKSNSFNATQLKSWSNAAVKFYKDRKNKGAAEYTKIKEVEYIMKYIDSRGRELFPFDAYWFLDELKMLERQFAKYLQAEVSNNTNYLINAAKLMEMMTNEGYVHVLNFNYTNPFKFDQLKSSHKKPRCMVANVTNVHGTYENDNIIFGIDATATVPSSAFIFTKTHRKMLQDTPSRALPWRVEEIKFYGHSLGQADYSYFQSIFDYYDLYGDRLIANKLSANPVILQFYFTIYDESRKTEIMRDAVGRVYRLITAYGNTLDNKDKGKNLLHKLLVEGRVQIEFFENI